MSNSIFDVDNYKVYLAEVLKNSKARGHGMRSQIAKTLGCNVAYVSQVLNKSANFSLEQAERLNQFLGHSKEESQYFLLLVQFARAGSFDLQQRLKDQIQSIQSKRLLLKERVDIKQSLSPLHQTQYYSAWYYAAVHIIVTILEYQDRNAIATKLGLNPERLNEALKFLTEIGLLSEKNGKIETGVNRLFLGSDSLMISKHHTNWRIRAIESLDRATPVDLHLSTLFTFAKDDLMKIRESIVQTMETTRKLVRESKSEEEIYCFNLDFFRVGVN